MEYNIAKTLFNKETLLKVIYMLSEEFNIFVKETEFNYILSVENKTKKEFNYDSFNAMLLEQQLRETLNNQFGDLRNAIYTKAFSVVER